MITNVVQRVCDECGAVEELTRGMARWIGVTCGAKSRDYYCWRCVERAAAELRIVAGRDAAEVGQ
jgi:hypothetical protein